MPRIKLTLACCGGLAVITALAFAANAQRPSHGGGPDAPEIKLVEQFDADDNGMLDTQERAAARKAVKKQAAGMGRRRPGPPGQHGPPGGQRRGKAASGKPGKRTRIADAEIYSQSQAGLYDPTVLRTLFLEFEAEDWEQELADFKPTDVEVPAKVTVDGTVYPDVGVSFRGASSFFMIPAGLKRSLNLSLDFVDSKQKLYGYKSLNLLNCNGDASMMSSLLYSRVAGKRMAVPKVNFMKVVINGRNWGVYANAQQFNKKFLKENFETKMGARWKVSGSPRGDGGLRYLGDSIEPYRERFDIKSKDTEESWRALINLCRVLNETPLDQLESALEPMLDIDGALWFLAVDVALVNSDGYWTRASDYNIYQNPDGKFHVLPHDMNEAFQASHHGPLGGAPPGADGRGRPPRGRFGPPPRRGGSPGGPGPGGQHGPVGGGVELEPLVGLENARMPLRSKLLALPKLQTRYLQYVREIAEDLQAWDESLGPFVAQTREVIVDEVAADTRKLTTTAKFKLATSDKTRARSGSLREFAAKRSAWLLAHDTIKQLPDSQSEAIGLADKTARP